MVLSIVIVIFNVVIVIVVVTVFLFDLVRACYFACGFLGVHLHSCRSSAEKMAAYVRQQSMVGTVDENLQISPTVCFNTL